MTKPAKNKEQTILEAAEREFLNKGFAGARTTSIAEAAGVTQEVIRDLAGLDRVVKGRRE